MEEEVSATFKIGIVLIMLSVAIAIGWVMFSSSRSYSTTITDNVGNEEINSMERDMYNRYDNKIVTGNDVINAIYKYNLNEIVLLVATQDWMMNGYNSYITGDTDELNKNGLDSGYIQHGNDIPCVFAYEQSELTNYGNQMEVDTTDGNKKLIFINYSALLGNLTNQGEHTQGTLSRFNNTNYYQPNIYYSDSTHEFICDIGFLTDEHNIKLSSNEILNLNNDKTTEYIIPTARFSAYILKDGLDTFLGLVFIENKI